ncbi:MAG: zinc-ribbon domain-containing protein [Deltaproteobacteria bacterium]|nr:zinc-ribbon domain-containing protein [Deltaproteobacteria bacterium]
MQFVCDRCKAKYDIDEARLRGKAVKIRCRGCGNVLEVRDPNLPAGSQPSLPPPPAARPRERIATPLAKSADSSPPAAAAGALGERFQKAFEGAGKTPAPGKLALLAAAAAPPTAAPAAALPDSDDATHIIASPFLGDAAKEAVKQEVSRKLARWHVSIRNQPMGPMSEEAIRRHIDNGEVGLNSLVWREGFDEWRPLGQVRDLGYLAEAASKKGAAADGAPWRGSVFELPPMAGAKVTTATSASLVPPTPGWNRWLVHGLVAVIAFALGMVFMYLVSGGAASPAAADTQGVVGIAAAEEAGTVEANLPTIRSGSLTIQLTNPTIVAEEEVNPAQPGTPGTTPSSGGSTGSRPRPSGGDGGRTGSSGTSGSSGTPPFLPGRDIGVGGQIRTGGGPLAAGGGDQPRPLGTDQILPVVSAGKGGIEHCYAQARQRDFIGDLALRLTLEISPDGSVRSATIASEDYITGDLESCIVGKVRAWQFPRAGATTRLVLPFGFHER